LEDNVVCIDQSCVVGSRVDALRQEIVGIDEQVPLLDGSTVPYVFLDNTASTPAFRGVQRKIDEFLPWYSSVHRGTGFKSLLSTHAYEESHEAVARFVGADLETHCVIFGKNTTEAINKLANRMALNPDDVVITTVMEHHSGDLPWRPRAQVEYVGLREDGRLDMDDLVEKVERFDGRVKLVATTGASNVTGFLPPIYDIAELAHQHGARILVDCAQLAPHRAIDVRPLDSPQHLDFVALSAHKMYAPFGTGALIGPREFFRQGAPDYRGGGTIEIVTLDEVYWAEPPERDEAGSPNVIGAVALAASISILSQVGMAAIAAHEAELTRYALRELNRLDGVKVYGLRDPDDLEDRLGVISFQVEGVPHGKVAAILAFEGGIGVRSGCFCAHPYVLRLLGVGDEEYQAYKSRVLNHDRSTLPGLVRVGLGCYNTAEDVDRLIAMLKRVIVGDYQGDYVVDRASGMYFPRGFDPAILNDYFAV
jgi:cysteine desulfurase/selenocysteine lyase